MEDDHLNPDFDDDYIKPQMSYCCGSRGIEMSPKFKDERNRCIFVGLTFVIKLVELTFIAFVVYDLSADGEDQLKFNFTLITLEELKPYNWIIFVAAGLILLIYFSARCGGIGRGFCAGLFMNILKTFSIAVFCAALISTEFWYPYRYIIFLVVVTIALICLGICLFTTLFEMNVSGREVYSAIFIYFLLIFFLSHFLYVATLREKYKMDYVQFLENIGIGGGTGLFLGMVMFWYIQELIGGRILSLNESECLFVTLLF